MDATHPNEAGQVALAEAMVPELLKLRIEELEDQITAMQDELDVWRANCVWPD